MKGLTESWKFGGGPGGGPAFSPMDFVDIVAKLLKVGYLDRELVLARLGPTPMAAQPLSTACGHLQDIDLETIKPLP